MYEDENHGLFSKKLAEWAIGNMKVKDPATGEKTGTTLVVFADKVTVKGCPRMFGENQQIATIDKGVEALTQCLHHLARPTFDNRDRIEIVEYLDHRIGGFAQHPFSLSLAEAMQKIVECGVDHLTALFMVQHPAVNPRAEGARQIHYGCDGTIDEPVVADIYNRLAFCRFQILLTYYLQFCERSYQGH